jgi:hypothetical protein
METAEKALECLLDRDGSTRDVNFTPVTREELVSFLIFLMEDYRLESACNADGHDLVPRLGAHEFDAALQGSAGYVHATLSNPSAVVRFLQFFVFWSPDEPGYGLEVSFFPDDVAIERFTLDAFLAMLTDWNGRLQADDYFVRYENASWKLYDASDPGVIFTRKRPPHAPT